MVRGPKPSAAFFLGEGLRLREHLGRIHDNDVAGRPGGITQLAALAPITEKIGLVATQNTTYNEPADLAYRLNIMLNLRLEELVDSMEERTTPARSAV